MILKAALLNESPACDRPLPNVGPSGLFTDSFQVDLLLIELSVAVDGVS